MSRRKSLINTVYQPIGTICLEPELVKRMKEQAELNGGVAAVVRACLYAVLYPESPEHQPLYVSPATKAPAPKEPEEKEDLPEYSTAADW